MAIFNYQAVELFTWLTDRDTLVVLDVRNEKDFNRFKIESPYPFEMINVSYYDFMEMENPSVARVPKDRKIRIVCAKEGSAKYVAEILEKHGYSDVGYLSGGIKTWGNMLVPKLITREDDFALYQFIRPGKASCSYGLISGREMMLFDPSRNIDFYLNFAKDQGCTVSTTFETHLQADYISGSRMIAEQTGATFYGNEADFGDSRNPYTPVVDGETHHFSHGGAAVTILFTPGHTPGSTSYFVNGRYMISGDMVFISSIGRPDLGGKVEEWTRLLYDSIQMVKRLDHNTLILPGHFMDWSEATEDLTFVTTLGETIDRNRDIYFMDNEADFYQFIQENMRAQPEEYAVIRLVNANLEQVDDQRAEELDLGKNECAATAYAQARAEQGNQK